MSYQALVLDANILVRAVLGQRVFKLLNQYHGTTAFFAPDEAFEDAEKYLPQIFGARGIDWAIGAAVLERLPTLVQCSVSNMMSIVNSRTTRENASAIFVTGRCWQQRWL